MLEDYRSKNGDISKEKEGRGINEDVEKNGKYRKEFKESRGYGDGCESIWIR